MNCMNLQTAAALNIYLYHQMNQCPEFNGSIAFLYLEPISCSNIAAIRRRPTVCYFLENCLFDMRVGQCFYLKYTPCHLFKSTLSKARFVFLKKITHAFNGPQPQRTFDGTPVMLCLSMQLFSHFNSKIGHRDS